MTQPGAYAGVAQTHGPTVAGAMQDVEMDEMPEAALECVRREGEPSQGFMNEGAWEDEDGGHPGTEPAGVALCRTCRIDWSAAYGRAAALRSILQVYYLTISDWNHYAAGSSSEMGCGRGGKRS